MELHRPFRPADSDLLTFLFRFIANETLHDDGFIKEHDVFKQEPWETYSYGCHCGGKDNGYRYLLHRPLHKKKGRRICRTVGENIGNWKRKVDGMISCDNLRISG
ncbi:hypothetical protein CQW23_14996 [Capsicum baccatum]|uniref:NAC domain-containing protein n=1 Tax=Capsicum baccatum TaxID=33114 RepID=A0A2G2WKS7_CAPBA|nr:hypothetical protein CQW23_14996 [Capsicum baccatum]